MRNLTIMIIALLSTTSILSAQSPTTPADSPTPKKVLSKFVVSYLNEPLRFAEGSIRGWIVDDSPSQDLLRVDMNLESTERANGVAVGLEYSYPSRFTWNADLSFSGNQVGKMFTGNLGFGYRIGTEKIHLIPMLRTGLGNGNFKLGDIQNEDVYIQINDTQYYDDEVEVRLKDFYAYVAPELNAFFAINDRMGVQLTAGLKQARSRKTRIQFSGYTDVEETKSASETREIEHERNFLMVNDVPLTEDVRLTDLGGAYFKASFVRVFGKK